MKQGLGWIAVGIIVVGVGAGVWARQQRSRQSPAPVVTTPTTSQTPEASLATQVNTFATQAAETARQSAPRAS